MIRPFTIKHQKRSIYSVAVQQSQLRQIQVCGPIKLGQSGRCNNISSSSLISGRIIGDNVQF